VSVIAGILLFGFIARYAGVNCSSVLMLNRVKPVWQPDLFQHDGDLATIRG
jgi:hypothetical protein